MRWWAVVLGWIVWSSKVMDLSSSRDFMSLFAQWSSAGALTFYTAGETPRAPRGHRAWLLGLLLDLG